MNTTATTASKSLSKSFAFLKRTKLNPALFAEIRTPARKSPQLLLSGFLPRDQLSRLAVAAAQVAVLPELVRSLLAVRRI